MNLVSPDAGGVEVAADWASLRTPENYIGYERTVGFASPGGLRPGSPHVYSEPERLPLNHWALSGEWTAGEQETRSGSGDGRDRLSVPGPRRERRDGTGCAGNRGALSGSCSTGSRRGRRTAATWTPTAGARSRTSGCTN